ncbi:glucosamine--fructose-6-phosphate aminotransferase [Rhizobium sp. Leaf384]|uniref:glutamine--fructose-6-phosphate transaminase (isomerizing) n=1 Tax=unclassified Rhizobium TaxID=2613769 RepID=UPI000715D53C|nr:MULTISPECIES: glutamine--fructose-6-phosphate transaminase (isomerizing) [unclassified Rhizobium]KQS76662.1 glucosamine--fructose-6-phosphate aminotransferase [Rhizobium sp. Leaf383]KQS77930.1 glucosamine--fructose-6-phosphate aminotransferase [Rhizobium sp. Leaf384]
MCGLVGIVSGEPVAGRLVDALRRLDYRGYDSAGIATIAGGRMERRRAAGKLANLQQRLDADPIDGTIGLGHTRWATHGIANETNAHPHVVGDVCIVHNGIIENFSELRQDLAANGVFFESETDTEILAHMLARSLADGHDPVAAMLAMLRCLRGAYAFAIMLRSHPGMMMAARCGPPLAIGHGHGEMFFGSDAVALAPFTNEVTYLANGDCAVITRDEATLLDACGHRVQRARQIAQSCAYLTDKGQHRHFMEKEITEQPEAISRVLASYVDFATRRIKVGHAMDFSAMTGVTISACGTAYLAGCIGKSYFERYSGLPAVTEVASELRYRDLRNRVGDAALFVSQSGETADTLAALHACRTSGMATGAVVNVEGSTIAREADAVFPIVAGPEIGVASTKAFTCQLAVFTCLAIAAGLRRGMIDAPQEQALVGHLIEVPRVMTHVLTDLKPQIEELASHLCRFRHVLYIGRGTSYPLALEGALKLKEIAYIHAEGYAAGELKHGPIALVDDSMPVIVIAPYDRFFEKTVSNMQEVAARGGKIIFITDEAGSARSHLATFATIVLPQVDDIIAPMIFALPLQMLAYHTAVLMGTDVDQPRNLAKSVTVE